MIILIQRIYLTAIQILKSAPSLTYLSFAHLQIFNEETGNFDTASVDSVLKQIEALNINDACVLIKSTVPVVFTSEIIKKYTKMRIVFSPEFLREGNAIEDTLYPSRIIVSGDEEAAEQDCRFDDLYK